MSTDRPGLGPFLRTLEQRLEACSVEQTRAALLEHGRRLAPDKREAFLSIFPAPGAESPTDRAADSGEELLVDIDNFVDRLASGVYYQDWGWDDDLDDERAWGDESWVEEMDYLFDAAGDAFIIGDIELARESYSVCSMHSGWRREGKPSVVPTPQPGWWPQM